MSRPSALLLGVSLLLLAPSGVQAQRGAWNVEELSRLVRTESTEYSDVWGYDAPDGTALAIVGYLTGTWILDVSDPNSPREVASIPGPTSVWRDIKTARGHAFVVEDRFSETSALQVIDLTEPRSPRLVLSTSQFFQRSHNISIDGDRLYCVGTFRQSGSPDEMVVLDISVPAAPVEIGRFGLHGFHDVYVRDGFAYGADFRNGLLVVLDVRDPANIEVVSQASDPGGNTHNTWLSADGRTCFVTSEREAGFLDIFDLSDRSAPIHIANWKLLEYPAASIHNVQVEGDLAFCSWYTAGLQILDVSQPRFPQRVGFFDTHPDHESFRFEGNWGVFPHTRSGLVYLSDIETGFHLLRFAPDHGTALLTLRDDSTQELLSGVRVQLPAPPEAPGDDLDRLSDGSGALRFLLPGGAHRLRLSRFGYEDAEVPVAVAAGDTLLVSATLTALPAGLVRGLVRSLDGSDEPIAGARVALTDSPLETHTGSDGSFEFPAVPGGVWGIEVERFGYRGDSLGVAVEPGAPSELAFRLLPALFADDFEVESGWTVGDPGDTAASGVWERVDPVGSGMGLLQAEDDHSEEGALAFVTQNGEPGDPGGEADVDGGATSLVSPLYDLTSLQQPVLVFYQWFTTSDESPLSGDFFTVWGSDDGGERWVQLALSRANAPRWERVEIDLGYFLVATDRIRFRFVAADGGTPSLVEAGLDDLQIHDGSADGPPRTPLGEDETFRLTISPNPFRTRSEFRLQLASAEFVRLRIHDVAGRLVSAVHEGPLEAGPHTFAWSGKDGRGDPVPSGVYLLSLEVRGRSHGFRVVRLP